MKKYAYYRDGLLPSLVVREVVDDNERVAEKWDYKSKKWRPHGPAWETIDDQRGNWDLDEEYVEEYIQKMLDRNPKLKEIDAVFEENGAVRKK